MSFAGVHNTFLVNGLFYLKLILVFVVLLLGGFGFYNR